MDQLVSGMKSEVKSEPQRHSANSFCDHHGICPSESRVSGEKAQLGSRLYGRSESSFQPQDSHLNCRYHYISLSESRLSGYSGNLLLFSNHLYLHWQGEYLLQNMIAIKEYRN